MLRSRQRLAVTLRQHASSLLAGTSAVQPMLTRYTNSTLSIPSFSITNGRRLFGTMDIPVNKNNKSSPRGRLSAGSDGPASPRLSSQEVIQNLNHELPLRDRENYLHKLTATQGRVPRYARLQLSPQLIDVLLPLINNSSSPLFLSKTIRSCGDLVVIDKKSKDCDRLVARMLDAISKVFAGDHASWSKSELISRSLLAMRKMNMKFDDLPVMQKNITLDVIDKGFRFHMSDAQRSPDSFTFTNLLHGAARLGVHWDMLLPSTQEAIQASIEFYGSDRLQNHQQAAMLLTGLAEMKFPLKTATKLQRRIVYELSFTTMDNVISIVQTSHGQSPRMDTTPEVISQSLAGVIFGLKEMGLTRSDFSLEQRKCIAYVVAVTCKHMPDVMVCQSLHNLSMMDMKWMDFEKEWREAILDTVFTTTLSRSTLHNVCLLLSGLVNLGVANTSDISVPRRIVIDRCVQRVLAVDSHVAGAHFVKSHAFARLLRSLGDINCKWTDFSIRTQQVLLGHFRSSFDFFTPRDLAIAVRGMGMLEVPLPVVQSPELFTCMMLAMERAHRDMSDSDVVNIIVGLGNMHVSWSMVPVGVRQQWVHVLRLGHGMLAPTNGRTLTRSQPSSSPPPTVDPAEGEEEDGDRYPRDSGLSKRDSASLSPASSAHSAMYNLQNAHRKGMIAYLLYGLGLMQASWASLEPPLQRFIIESLYNAPQADTMFPVDAAHIVWGLGRMGVRWPDDLQYAPPSSSSPSSSSASLSPLSPSSSSKKDQIPVGLLIACRSALHGTNNSLIDLAQIVHGFSLLGVTWDALATTTGGFHHRLLQRTAHMCNWASTTNVVKMMHDFACLSFDSDWRFLVDKPTTTATTTANATATTTANSTTPAVFTYSPSLLETFGIFLCVLHHNRALSRWNALSPSSLEKYHQTIAYLATLPITDQWTHPSFVEAIESLAFAASTRSPLKASLLAPAAASSSPSSSSTKSQRSSSGIQTLPSPTSMLTSQVADVLRETLGPVLRDADVSVHEGWAIPAPDAASKRTKLPFAPQFNTTDIVLRRRSSSGNAANDPRDIVAIVEIDDQRVPCIASADNDHALDRDDARYHAFVNHDLIRDVGVDLEPRFAPLGPPPQPMAGARPHRLKRHLYRQYLPHVPIFLVEVKGPLVVVQLEAGESSYLDTFDRETPLTATASATQRADSESPRWTEKIQSEVLYDPRGYVARAALRHGGETQIRVASWAAKRSKASPVSDASIVTTMENLRQSPAVKQAAAQIRETILAAAASSQSPSVSPSASIKKTAAPRK